MKNKSENRKYIHIDILDKLTSERIHNESHWIGVNRKKGGRWNWQTDNFRTISFMLRIWINRSDFSSFKNIEFLADLFYINILLSH